ncbi:MULTISPECIES: Ig-like domain-containing protein [Streptomyces]|uniref:glycoside hydrolase family 78 protein n=1 Tax=Streptomyces TaxID=1883 RepID=UPI003658A908
MVARTIIGNSKFLTRFTGQNASIIKRPVHDLPDGRCLVLYVDENDAASNYGTKNNQPVIRLYMGDVGRTVWTQVASYTLPAGLFPTGAAALHCGSTVLNDGGLFFAWRGNTTGTNKYGLYGVFFNRLTSTTWANPTSYETIFIPQSRYPYRLDLDVTKSNQVVVGWMYSAVDSTSSPMGFDIFVRLGTNNYKALTGGYGLGSTGNIHPLTGSEDFTLAVDQSSDTNTTRLMFMTAVVSSKKDYGDTIGYRTFRNSDGVTLQAGYVKTGFNAGRGGGRRNGWMWSTGPGEFTIVGGMGTTALEAYVVRYKTTSALTAAATFSNTIPVTYNPRKPTMNRDGSLYLDVSAAYANGNFSVIYHDTSAFRDLYGNIRSGNKVWWDQGVYAWANGGKWVDLTTSYADAPAAAVYGGSRYPNVDGVSASTLLIYFSRTKLTTTDAVAAYHINWTHRAPNSTVPGAGSIVNSGTPVLGVYADIDQPTPRTPVVIRWQIAKDSGFTQSLKDYYSRYWYSVSGTDVDGTYVYLSEPLPQELALSTGTWYIRAAQIDGFQRLGLWTSPAQFTVSHAPWASGLSPSGGSIFAYGAGNVTFTWRFNDPYTADHQSAYRVLVETNDEAPTVVVDTGKITGADSYATVAIPDTAKNTELRWSVQLWDMDDNPGNLSAYELITVADPPTITPVDPVDGGVVDNARPNIQWQFASALDATQVAYRVYFLSDGVMVHDSNWINSDTQSYQAPDIILKNETSYSMVISVRDSAGLENQVSVSFTTQWDLPADPDINSLIIDTTFYDKLGAGYVKVTWANQATDPDFLSWRLYRRYNLANSAKDGDKGLDWELMHEEFSVSPPDGGDTYEYLDYSAPSGYEVHYMLTQTAVRFGSIVESNRPDLTDPGKIVNLYSSHYWLILPDADGDVEDVIRIEHATSDSYTDEYEEEVMTLIGRGRHVEKGDRLGYSGSLNMELRFIEGVYNTDDPRRQKIDLERFAAMRTNVWIRSPFGDLFMASTGDMQFDRIAGVGQSEFTNVTLPYREVYVNG